MSATDFMSPRPESNRPNPGLNVIRGRGATVAATAFVRYRCLP
jgi:hypothetical protein